VEVPDPGYLRGVRELCTKHSVLWIADEVQTGLGRTGVNMWAFMEHGVVPDIVTVGKGLGNGYPMGAVICSKEISDKLGGYFSTFGGNPVACSIGLCVLEIVKNEKLQSSAKMVGKHLQNSLINLKDKFSCIGDIRGSGLLQAIEIVNNRQERIPAGRLAAEIMFEMKAKNIVIQLTGRNQNVILITPPMCFNIENSRMFVQTLEEILNVLEQEPENSLNLEFDPIKIGSKRSNILLHTEDSEPSRKIQINDEEDEYDSLCDMD